MSTAVGASVLAHGLHYAMVLAGLWGLTALLLPHALSRVLPGASPPDEHSRRVAQLRAAVAVGAPGIAAPAAPPSAGTSVAAPATAHLSLPLAVVASAAAAGIHAAVAPPHLREQVLAGVFFLVAALAQLLWALAVQRPTVALLRTGVALHGGLVLLWAVTRTAGLPFGLLDGPHPVGPWDLACVAWQVLALASCVRLLHDPAPPVRLAGWFDWPPTSRAAVGAAAVSLVLLTLSGAHS